ncbi:MAG: hypothetical protein NZO58_13730, partial [Gemmataceae bacterium]|nr:hypothetical protein [Gemmataceae bacterium]
DDDGMELQFDDGDRALVPPSELARLEFPEGAEIQARIDRELRYLPAIVLKQKGNALLLRLPDLADSQASEDVTIWTSVAMVRIDRAATVAWLRRN